MNRPVLSPARLMAAGIIVLAVLGPSGAGAGVSAPAAESGAAAPDSVLVQRLARLPGEPLGLEAAIRSAIAGDTALAIARADLAAAAGAASSRQGAFAPELFGRADWSGDRQPTSSFFAGADVLATERTTLAAGTSLLLPTGTRLGASLNTSRLQTNSDFAVLSPQHDASGELTLVQPLLKGFGPAARADRDAALGDLEGAGHRLDDAWLAVRSRVEAAYWALYAAERDLVVLELVRDQAAAFLAEVRQRVDAGLVGPAEEASARAFLAEAEQVRLDGLEQLDAASDRLAILLGRRPAGAQARFRAIDTPPTSEAPAPLDRLLTSALELNPRVLAAQRAAMVARIRARGAAWQALPQLDLVGAIGGRGLAGTGREVVVDFGGGGPTTLSSDLDTGLGDGLGQVLRREHATWTVGLMFSVPLGGGRDRGERDRLRAEVVRAEQQHEALRREVEADVRALYRTLVRSQERLDHAGRGVAASLEQVRIGNLEYAEGRTTAFTLVRLAAELAAAQRRYSDALVRSTTAAAGLRRLTGGAHPGDGPTDTDLEATKP